jgi:hypothetical protein
MSHGRFAGIIERIEEGYFEGLGVTALSLMPLAEFPTPQGPNALGYNPSVFFTVERDFGSPDNLRRLVDTAHRHGLAVVLDQVNHTDNDFNPLWKSIIEHPDEEARASEGGLYFNGSTRWGNRVATEKRAVQNMLIDACRLIVAEYHVDGFRFDATHTDYMDHGFLLRLAGEIKRDKPDALLIAENLPNQPDLNRQGFDGFAQWYDPFHDKMKALLREGVFENTNFYDTERLGIIFFFSRDAFAAHTPAGRRCVTNWWRRPACSPRRCFCSWSWPGGSRTACSGLRRSARVWSRSWRLPKARTRLWSQRRRPRRRASRAAASGRRWSSSTGRGCFRPRGWSRGRWASSSLSALSCSLADQPLS